MDSEIYKYREELKLRTKSFALRIVKLYQSLPKTVEAQLIGKQLFRSGTSVAANYRIENYGNISQKLTKEISPIFFSYSIIQLFSYSS
jgi:hypothetical protein